MTIKTIMTSDVLTMKPDVPFEQVQDVMRKVPFHHILVADDNKKLLGVISDRDLMSQVSKYINDNNGESFTDFLPRLSAADIMTANPITIDQDTPIDAASILL
ncbi:MAG: CBS domain-containing protein [Reinekea sp.]|nr:CBS domain-containing protein [Reinekea sp.]